MGKTKDNELIPREDLQSIANVLDATFERLGIEPLNSSNKKSEKK